MRYDPVRIILKQALRYMDETKRQEVLKIMAKKTGKGKQVLNTLFKHFDVKQFKDNPLIEEDEILYRYIMCQIGVKIRRNGLIAEYERQAYIDDDDLFWESLKKKKKSPKK